MFKFKDLSNTEDELFRPENYQLSVKDFFCKAPHREASLLV